MKITSKIKHAFISLILIFGFHFHSSAQLFVLDLPPGYNKVESLNFEKGLDGSPWLSDTWIPGVAKVTNGKVIKGLKYRYNVYRNQLYFQSDNEIYKISTPDSIDQVEFDGKKFVYQKSDPLLGNKRFLEVAVDGKAKLFINYYTEILPPNYNKALGSGSVNETIIIKKSFLIKVEGLLVVLDKKGKQFSVVFADKKPEITAFLKQENISCKEITDVEKVVNYYNSLK